ncbi:hypothetical protein Pen01_36050 [Phytomonospora endophytica]|nr:hypothetical protein Pen01_36050 [Phytomonospora endophytica]
MATVPGASPQLVQGLGHRIRTGYTGPTPYLTCPRSAPCRSCRTATHFRDRTETPQCPPCREANLAAAINPDPTTREVHQ